MEIERLKSLLEMEAKDSLVARDRYDISQEDIDGEIERAISTMFKLSKTNAY